jgi:putative holliday junction resolvase
MKSRILSVDYGLARIGLALSDETKILASPITLLKAEKQTEKTALKLAEHIKILEKQYGCTIEEVVIGLPLMMSGKMSFLADEVKHFTELLKQSVQIPIILWDERLTSVQAERSMMEGNLSRKKRTQNVDSLSAVIILQNYLDKKNLV